MPLDMQTLGQRIRTAREVRGLSQEEFAARISRDQRAVSEYENGKRRISVTDLPHFADVLDVPLSYLYEETITPDSWDAALLKEFHRLVRITGYRRSVTLPIDRVASADSNGARAITHT